MTIQDDINAMLSGAVGSEIGAAHKLRDALQGLLDAQIALQSFQTTAQAQLARGVRFARRLVFPAGAFTYEPGITVVGGSDLTGSDILDIESVRFIVQAGGGGGTGIEIPTGTNYSVGAGGNAGHFASHLVAAPAASYSLTVGAGGAGGSGVSGNNGSAGGNSIVSDGSDVVYTIGGFGNGALNDWADVDLTWYAGSAPIPSHTAAANDFYFTPEAAPYPFAHNKRITCFPNGASSVFGRGGVHAGTGGRHDPLGAGAGGYGRFQHGQSGFTPGDPYPGGDGADGLIIVEEYEAL